MKVKLVLTLMILKRVLLRYKWTVLVFALWISYLFVGTKNRVERIVIPNGFPSIKILPNGKQVQVYES